MMRKRASGGKIEVMLLVTALAFIFTIVVCPAAMLFAKAFTGTDGLWCGFANFQEYFASPNLRGALVNSLGLSFLTAAAATVFAFVYAYALTRTSVPVKWFFRFIAVLPLCAPTMLFGIALVYLIGNKGLLTLLGLKLPLYGPLGIIISEIVYTFPQAFLILSITLSYADNRLYEAARAMGASASRIFFTVTLPGAKAGLLSAFLVSFSLCFADFGAPKVVGGNFSMLATDIYKQVIGLQNFGMGAVVGILLMIPSIIIFLTDSLSSSGKDLTIGSRSVNYKILRAPKRDALLTIFCIAVSSFILLLFAAAAAASLIRSWPYDLSLTLAHFTTESPATGGLSSFKNSVITALASSLLGTAFVFVNAWLVEKSRADRGLRAADHFISLLPLSLPGLSIGLSFIFFFTLDGNPLKLLYGTAAMPVLANIVHFYSVPYVASISALKKLDPEIEAVSDSMSVPLYRTFFKVTAPMCRGAIAETALYFFVNSMVTVSAVIFLYPPDFKLASVAIVNMEEVGDIAEAAALSMLVVLLNAAVKLLFEFKYNKGAVK
mgnify:CR=1 FL=1